MKFSAFRVWTLMGVFLISSLSILDAESARKKRKRKGVPTKKTRSSSPTVRRIVLPPASSQAAERTLVEFRCPRIQALNEAANGENIFFNLGRSSPYTRRCPPGDGSGEGIQFRCEYFPPEARGGPARDRVELNSKCFKTVDCTVMERKELTCYVN